MRLRFVVFLSLAGLATPALLSAQTQTASSAPVDPAGGGALLLRDSASTDAVSIDATTGRPRVQLSPTQTPPSVDGRLDDIVWQSAARITEFTQQRPVEGDPASEDTDIWLAFDNSNLYVAIHAHYSDPAIIRANRSDRDSLQGDDTVSLYFDTFFDQQRAYVFTVNGYGVQGDSLMGGSGGGGGGRGGGGRGGGGRPAGGGNFGQGDPSWDALFSSSGRLVDGGWVAEMAIPFKSLRYPQREQGIHRWGLQIQRTIGGKGETVHWAPLSRDINGFLRQMGTVDGMTDLSTSRNLEFLPGFTAIGAGALNETTGRFESIDSRPEGSLNVKYGITSNLTADFTVNPDFSQIESDVQQIEVNQRFPVFYPERRPFFLEGQEIFSTAGAVNVVHTRTIVDPAYGAKLTGKIGKTTMGVLFASDEAPGNLDDPTEAGFGQKANAFIARAKYDVLQESYLGVVLTDREFADSYSRLGGIDGLFRIGQTATADFRIVASDRLDLEGVRETGPMIDLNFRSFGRNLIYGISHNRVDPEFGTELGFVRRVDTQETRANVNYRWWPESTVRNYGPALNYTRNYDYAGVLQDEVYNLNMRVQFSNNMNVNAGVSHSLERYNDIDFEYTRMSVGGNVNAFRLVSFGGSYNNGNQINFVDDPFLGRGNNLNAYLNFKPFSRLDAQLNVDTSKLVDPRDESEIFDVKIFRAQTSYQFTDRLVFRNITDWDTYEKTLGLNFLVTYRVNSGTVFYVGYDDRYQAGNQIDDVLFPQTDYERTNRAIFTKLQYLFRY